MKRAIGIVVAVAWTVAAAGCSPDEQARQQKQAEADFIAALGHITNATSGFVPEMTLAASDAQLQAYLEKTKVPAANTTLGWYQQRELNTAIGLFTPLLQAGSTSQQTAAALAHAQAHAMLAQMHKQMAVAAWANQAGLANQALIKLRTTRQSHTLAQTHAKLNQNQHLANTRAKLRQVEERRSAKIQEVNNIQRTLLRLRGSLTKAEELRKQNADAAADRTRRSFQSTGPARFDLAEEAATLTLAADAAAAQAQALIIDIDRAEAEKAVALAEQAQIDHDLNTLQAIITEFEQRKSRLADSSTLAAAAADTGGEALVAALNDRAARYEAEVIEQFEQARTHLVAAVDALDQVAGRAQQQPDRQALKAAGAAAQAELGLMLHQVAEIDKTYAQATKLIADQAEAGVPDKPATQIAQMSAAADERHTQSVAAAVDVLGAAADALKDAEPGEETDEGQLALMLHLKHVYEALATLTGDEAEYRGKLIDVQAEIDKLQAP